MPENEGGEAAPTNTAPPADQGQQAPPAEKQPAPEDWHKRYEDAVANSRKWEDRAKANKTAAEELAELKKQGMTDLEKAAAEARAEGAAEARKQFGARLVDAEVRAAAAGRDKDVIDGLLDGLDRSKFLTDEGEPDTKAIAKWVERVAPKQATPPLDLGQGARAGTEAAPDMNDRIRQRLRT